MSKLTDFGIVLDFILFAVNVFGPCDRGEVEQTLERIEKRTEMPRRYLTDELQRGLDSLEKGGYISRISTNQYFATYRGVKLLSEKGVGFPRDKHRLYFLKRVIGKRGQ